MALLTKQYESTSPMLGCCTIVVATMLSLMQQCHVIMHCGEVQGLGWYSGRHTRVGLGEIGGVGWIWLKKNCFSSANDQDLFPTFLLFGNRQSSAISTGIACYVIVLDASTCMWDNAWRLMVWSGHCSRWGRHIKCMNTLCQGFNSGLKARRQVF